MAVHEEARTSVYVDGDQAKNVINELTKDAERYKKAIIEANEKGDLKAYKAAQKDLERVNKEMQKLEREAFDVDKVLKNLNGASIRDLEKAQRKLNRELRKPGVKRNSKEWDENKDKLVAVKTELKKVRGEMNVTTKSSGGLIQSAKDLLPAFGFTAIIAGIMGIGKRFFDLSQQTMGYRQTVSKTTGLIGKELADTTAGIEATSQTFKKEVSDLIPVNNTLAKTFKISQQRATELINKGFLDGADASGEFIDMLKEYPVQFKAAGLSAEESIALMSQSVKEGVYSDKGPDVIKEGTLRLREMTKATREAIDGIGLSSTELEADLKKGTITYFEAIQKVSNKLNELPPQSVAVGQALADIFGGPGEDAGLEYVKMLGNVDKGLQSVNTTATESQIAQKKLLESNQRLTKAWSNLLGTGTSMFTSIKAGINNMLSGTLEAFTSMENYTRSEMKRVNMLAIEMTDANTPTERRNELYAELKRIAPDVVANIDKENISVSTLRSNLEKYNEVMIKKLALQDSESALDEEREKAGEATSKRVEKEMQLREELYSIQQQAARKNPELLDQIKEINLANDDVITKQEKIMQLLGDQRNFYRTNADGLTSGIVSAREAEKEATDNVTKAMDAYMARYNAVFGENKGEQTVNTSVFTTMDIKEFKDDDPDDKEAWKDLDREIEEYLKKYEAAQKQIAEIRKQSGLDEGGDQYAIAMEQLQKSYDDKLISEEQFQEAKKAIKDAYKIMDLEADILEAETDQEKWDAKLDLAKERYDQEFAAAEGNRLKELQAKKKYEGDVKKIEADGVKAKIDKLNKQKAIKDAETDVAMDGLAALRSIVGEETALGKMLFLAEQAMAVGRIWFHTGIANAKAVAAMPLTGGQPWVTINTVSAGVQTAKVLAQTIGQFAEGRYPVRGASDGKVYNAQYTPELKTGVYSQPSIGLFSEIDPEMVVDGATTKRLMFDYPEVYNGILSLSRGGAPQFADGRYPESANDQTTDIDLTDDNSIISILQQSTATTQELNTILKKGIRAVLIYKELEEMEEEVETIKNAANL